MVGMHAKFNFTLWRNKRSRLFWAHNIFRPKIWPVGEAVLPGRTCKFSIKGKSRIWKFHWAINRFWMRGGLPAELDYGRRLRSQRLSTEVLACSSLSTITCGMWCAKTDEAAIPQNKRLIVEMLTQGNGPSGIMAISVGIHLNSWDFCMV